MISVDKNYSTGYSLGDKIRVGQPSVSQYDTRQPSVPFGVTHSNATYEELSASMDKLMTAIQALAEVDPQGAIKLLDESNADIANFLTNIEKDNRQYSNSYVTKEQMNPEDLETAQDIENEAGVIIVGAETDGETYTVYEDNYGNWYYYLASRLYSEKDSSTAIRNLTQG